MNIFEATFTEISKWQKNIHYSTGGTRSKYIALHPETNDEYFFKGSKETLEGETRYPTEFWSEIVSSKIGQLLGFPMLDYNIAFDINHKQKIGCLSKSMVSSSANRLTEGVTYLTGYDSKYDPQTDKKEYTLQFIFKALKSFSYEKYINNIIEIIIFDSIIGNSDRHQENWGIITTHRILIEEKKIQEDSSKPKKQNFYKQIKKFGKSFFSNENNDLSEILLNENFIVKFKNSHEFAPIYDSGCCLGREYLENEVVKMINDNQMLNAYINRGKAEIHWETYQEKRKHFELIELLLEKYPEETRKHIFRVKEKYDDLIIKEIIDKIDVNIPQELIDFKLSNNRKELMYKLITLRIKKIISYI